MKLLVLLILIFQDNYIKIISYGILYSFYRNHYNMYKKNIRKFGKNLRLGIRLSILKYVILNCFSKNRNRKYNKNNRNQRNSNNNSNHKNRRKYIN